MELVFKPLADLIPYAGNVMDHGAEQVREIADGIREYGFNNPILLAEDGTIIAGHGRALASELMGLEQVPCIVLSHLSESKRRAYAIADNKLSRKSTFNFEKLSRELKALAGEVELSGLGFTDSEMDALLESVEGASLPSDFLPSEYTTVGEHERRKAGEGRPDPGEARERPELSEAEYDPGETVETDIKTGDVIHIGRHVLVCGDSTKADFVEYLCEGRGPFDIGFNDPPYGMGKEAEGVANDNLYNDKLLEFNRVWIGKQWPYLKENGSFYVWGMDEGLMDIYAGILKPMCKAGEATFRNLITWSKGSGQGQNSDNTRMYAIADEKALFLMRGVQGFNNNQDNYFEGFEPIREYLQAEINKLGKTDKEIANLLGYASARTVNHWHSKSQWAFPTRDNYEALRLIAESLANDAFKREYDEVKREYYKGRAYFDNTHDNMNNVWHFKRCHEGAKWHATPKPVALVARAILSSSPESGKVVDFFGGGGSTMVACEQLGRECALMEIDPRNCQIIVNRMREHFPGLDISINGRAYG